MNLIKSFIFSVLAATLIAGGVFVIQKKNILNKEAEFEIALEKKEESFETEKQKIIEEQEKEKEEIKLELKSEKEEEAKKLAKEIEKIKKEKEEIQKNAQEQIKETEMKTRLLEENDSFKEGKLQIANQRYSDAIETFKTFQSSQDLYGEAQFMLAAIQSFVGNEVEALKNAQNASKQEVTAAQKAQAISNAYATFKTFKEGKPEFREALLASAYLETGELQLAKQKSQQIITSHPDYKDAHIILGLTQFAEKNYEDTIKTLNSQTPLNNPRADYYLGLAYYNTQQFREAAEQLEIALQGGYEDDLRELKETLAESYTFAKRYDRAASIYEENIKEFDQPASYYVRPIVLYIEQLQKPDRAIALSQHGISKYPKEAMMYNLGGWANLSAGNLDEAAKLLDKAINIDKKLAAAYLNYGHLYVKRKDYPVAKQYYEDAVKHSPESSIGIRAREEINKILTGVYK